MNKVDPIIAVNDVRASSLWYQKIFDCQSMHGGDHFDVLVDSQGEVFLCLHQWGRDDHPTMMDPVQPGNGLILYLRTSFMQEIHGRATASGVRSLTEIQPSPNSGKMEFSLFDPDGYCWIVSEAHAYQG